MPFVGTEVPTSDELRRANGFQIRTASSSYMMLTENLHGTHK
jgi:hypothetical protein